MKILEQKYALDFLRMANDGWAAGWHEANGGNLSYRLKTCERNLVKSRQKHGNWERFEDTYKVPELAGDFFMISATGSHFRSFSSSPKKCLGIIEINSSGTAYRHIWGFKGNGRPTCELPTHLMIHALKKEQTGGKSRVVYHAHPANLIALCATCKYSGKQLTRKLWGSMSEAAIVFPEGIGMLSWMVPGSIELGIASCKEMTTHNAVVWSNHGLIVCGETFDQAFGLAHTIDKAAGIAIKTQKLSGNGSDPGASMITPDDLKRLSDAFSLNLDLS